MVKIENYKLFAITLVFIISLSFSSAFNFETNGVKIVEPLQSNGAIPVNIQDQTSRAIIVNFVESNITTISTLQNNATFDSYEVNITNITYYSTGNLLGLFDGDNYYYGEILAINGNTATLDTPLDYNYSTSSIVISQNDNLNVDGSTTRRIFEVQLPQTSEIEVDITRILFEMTCVTEPNFNEFCDLPALTNGIVFRRVNTMNQNYFNVKTNSGLTSIMYDVGFYYQSRNANDNGVTGRLTFAGQSKIGVSLRIKPGDKLQIIVQDDLSGLVDFKIVAEGHILTN